MHFPTSLSPSLVFCFSFPRLITNPKCQKCFLGSLRTAWNGRKIRFIFYFIFHFKEMDDVLCLSVGCYTNVLKYFFIVFFSSPTFSILSLGKRYIARAMQMACPVFATWRQLHNVFNACDTDLDRFAHFMNADKRYPLSSLLHSRML